MNNGLPFYTLVLLEAKEMNLPSEMYFRGVKTKEDWQRMMDSGCAWVLEEFFPFTWQEHCEMCEYKESLELNKEGE